MNTGIAFSSRWWFTNLTNPNVEHTHKGADTTIPRSFIDINVVCLFFFSLGMFFLACFLTGFLWDAKRNGTNSTTGWSAHIHTHTHIEPRGGDKVNKSLAIAAHSLPHTCHPHVRLAVDTRAYSYTNKCAQATEQHHTQTPRLGTGPNCLDDTQNPIKRDKIALFLCCVFYVTWLVNGIVVVADQIWMW